MRLGLISPAHLPSAKDAGVSLHGGGGKSGLVGGANIIGGLIVVIVRAGGGRMGMLCIDELIILGPDFTFACEQDVCLRVGGLHVEGCFHPCG